MPDISVTDILPFIGVVVGAAIGAILTYLVERAVQTRSWKREFANKKIETIYVPLYREVIAIHPAIRTNWIYPTPSSAIHATAWDEVKGSESKLLIAKPLLDQLEKLYDIDLPRAQNSFEKAYRAILRTTTEYFRSLAEGAKVPFNQTALESLASEVFNYFSTLLMDDWEAFKKQFLDNDRYASYMDSLQAQLASHLKLAASGSELPSNYLHQIKFRIDNLEEVKSAKTNREDLIRQSEVVANSLQKYITQYWAIGKI